MTNVTITKKTIRNSFLLSIIFHLLLLLLLVSLSTIITVKPVENTQKSPQLYIPSYVYKGAVTPATEHSKTENSSQTHSFADSQNTTHAVKTTESKPGTLAIPLPQKTVAVKKRDPFQQKSILDMSRNMIQQNQMSASLNQMNNTEPPILLVGDKHMTVDPLAKLIGRSLSAHFHYPDVEGIFGARGRVYISLVIHPEGYYSDVQIVQPSEIQDFNTAALYAVNTAPTVVGIGKFLAKPTRFIVGFIFD